MRNTGFCYAEKEPVARMGREGGIPYPPSPHFLNRGLPPSPCRPAKGITPTHDFCERPPMTLVSFIFKSPGLSPILPDQKSEENYNTDAVNPNSYSRITITTRSKPKQIMTMFLFRSDVVSSHCKIPTMLFLR